MKLINCDDCKSLDIEKSIMSPRISSNSNSKKEKSPSTAGPEQYILPKVSNNSVQLGGSPMFNGGGMGGSMGGSNIGF